MAKPLRSAVGESIYIFEDRPSVTRTTKSRTRSTFCNWDESTLHADHSMRSAFD
jgi:hypothetical protein